MTTDITGGVAQRVIADKRDQARGKVDWDLGLALARLVAVEEMHTELSREARAILEAWEGEYAHEDWFVMEGKRDAIRDFCQRLGLDLESEESDG